MLNSPIEYIKDGLFIMNKEVATENNIGELIDSNRYGIIELTDKITNEFQANQNKISLIGFSFGCYGGINVVKANQQYFSAAVLIGCDCYTDQAKYFVNTPVWTFVGSGSGTNTMPSFVSEVNKLGGTAKHTQVNGKPHNVLNNDYSILRDDNYKVIDWMISQTKK